MDKKLTRDEFIIKSKSIHNDKFDYSLVNYINTRTKVTLICNKCKRYIEMTPTNHILGNSCYSCSRKEHIIIEDIFKQLEIIHNNYYKYDNILLEGYRLNIECPKHGLFNQSYYIHKNKHGCPKCHLSKGELHIMNYLDDNNIVYIREYSFIDCLGDNKPLRFDFYLPDHNICIEYNGQQHYESIEYFGGLEYYNKVVRYDKIKKNYCLFKDIKLITISYLDNLYILNEIFEKL